MRQERKKKIALLDGSFAACIGAYKEPYAEGGWNRGKGASLDTPALALSLLVWKNWFPKLLSLFTGWCIMNWCWPPRNICVKWRLLILAGWWNLHQLSSRFLIQPSWANRKSSSGWNPCTIAMRSPMLGGYHVRSDGDEPSSLMDSYWFYICGTVILALLQVSWKKGHSFEAYLQNEQKIVFPEQKHKGAMCAHVSCPSDSTAAWQMSWVSSACCIISEMVLEALLSHSPFKRQNLRLGNLGTELNSNKKVMIKK